MGVSDILTHYSHRCITQANASVTSLEFLAGDDKESFHQMILQLQDVIGKETTNLNNILEQRAEQTRQNPVPKDQILNKRLGIHQPSQADQPGFRPRRGVSPQPGSSRRPQAPPTRERGTKKSGQRPRSRSPHTKNRPQPTRRPSPKRPQQNRQPQHGNNSKTTIILSTREKQQLLNLLKD